MGAAPDTATFVMSAVGFIEDHLQTDVTVADMADSAGYSLFHFSRVFSRATGHTPYDYLMRRRLTEAAARLLTSDDRIIDVAFAYRFGGPETFCRAFRRVFECAPSEYRAGGVADAERATPPLTDVDLEWRAAFSRPGGPSGPGRSGGRTPLR
jgi:AraC-like DNA-binding protein